MNGTYYYFAASLPVLHFKGKPPFSTENFIEDCARLLSPGDFREVEGAINLTQGDTARTNLTAFKYRAFLRDLGNETVLSRASLYHRNPQDFIKGDKNVNLFASGLIAQASKIEDPFEAESFLDQAKWDYLDELTSGHFFDLDVIVAYAVKLKILERHQEFMSPKGKETFDKYKQECLAKKE